jgi:hypothetical protein
MLVTMKQDEDEPEVIFDPEAGRFVPEQLAASCSVRSQEPCSRQRAAGSPSAMRTCGVSRCHPRPLYRHRAGAARLVHRKSTVATFVTGALMPEKRESLLQPGQPALDAWLPVAGGVREDEPGVGREESSLIKRVHRNGCGQDHRGVEHARKGRVSAGLVAGCTLGRSKGGTCAPGGMCPAPHHDEFALSACFVNRGGLASCLV